MLRFQLIGVYHTNDLTLQISLMCTQSRQQYMLREITRTTTQDCFLDPHNDILFYLKDNQIVSRSISEQQQHSKPFMIPSNQATTEVSPSEHRLQLISGDVAFNKDKTLFTNISENISIVKGTVCTTVGTSMVWQFYAPISLIGISFGICKIKQKQKQKQKNAGENQKYEFILIQLNASTSRTVTLMVSEKKLFCWVNGSKPNKHHVKELQTQQGWFPCFQIKSYGNSIIYNPFATVPNTNFNIYNPFQSVKAQAPTLPNKVAESKKTFCEIKKITQLNNDTCLLVDKNNKAKIIYRNTVDNLFHAPSVYYDGIKNSIMGILTKEQHNVILEYFKQDAVNFNWGQAYDFDYILDWISYLIGKIDKTNKAKNWNKVLKILLTNLAILRQLNYERVSKILRNPIYGCQLDREIYHANEAILERKLNGANDLVKISKVQVLNQKPFLKLDGQIISYSANYFCTCDNQKINIYSTQCGIIKIFESSISSILNQPFNKKAAFQQINQKHRELFSVKSQGPSIYKILAYCLDENVKQKEQYLQFSERDLNQLIRDFKIPEEDAKAALSVKGNVEDAMVWLAQGGNAKSLKPRQNISSQKNIENVKKHTINMIQLNKQNRNEKISPFCKLILQIDNKVLILGFFPQTTLLNKLEKGYMDMKNFSFISQLKDIDTDSWCEGSNYPQLMILDSLTNLNGETLNVAFIRQQQQRNLYLIVNNSDILMKIKLTILSENIYTNESCLKLDTEQIPISQQFLDANQLLCSRKGELYCQITQKKQFLTDTVIVKSQPDNKFSILSNCGTNQQNYITFKLQTGQNFSEIVSQLISIEDISQYDQSSKQQINWIPMLVESGPPGCNLNYPICSILYPRAPFLANYPYSIKFKHLHNKYMKISSIKIQRINKNKAVNQIKQGVIFFSDDAGRTSKEYEFVFAPDDKQMEVKVNEKSFWKYMVIIPTFKDKNQKSRKNPYEIGFVGAKGTAIESNLFETAVKDTILENIHFEGIEQYQVIESKGLQDGIYQIRCLSNIGMTIKKTQIKNKQIFSQILDVKTFSLKKNVEIAQKDKSKKNLKHLIKLQVEELVRFLSKNLQIYSKAITFLINNPNFSFEKFNDGQIRKFIDLLSMSSLSRKNYTHILDKIYKQCPAGQKYFTEIIQFMGFSQYGGSLALLNNLIMRMNEEQAQIILQGLLTKIEKIRSPQYQQLRRNGHPYLLLQNNFYSQYYTNQLDKYTQKKTLSKIPTKIFTQENIKDIKFVVIKEQYLRKIIVDMKNIYNVMQLALRFEKTDFVNKLYIKVFCWTQTGNKFQRSLILNSQILQHQWIQITKNPYRKEMMDMFGKNQGLDCFGLNIGGIDCRYLEIQLLHTVDGTHGQNKQAGLDPFIDIIPEIYGSKSCQKTKLSTQILSLSKQFFQLKADEIFFISKVQNNENLSKFSVSKSLSAEFFYFEYQSENVRELISKMHDKVRNKQYEGAIALNKKIIEQGNFVRSMGLDYAYTLYIKILKKLSNQNHKVSRNIAEKISQIMIKKQIGPIQQLSLKSVSHYVDLVFDCLQYVKENQAPILEQIQLTQTQIFKALKSQDSALCKILTNIIIKSLPCEPKWIEFVIQLTEITKDNEIATKFLLSYEHWYVNDKFLVYLSVFSNKNQQKLEELMSKKDLYRFLFAAYKIKLPIKYSQIIKSILNNKDPYIQDSIVQIILDQKPVNWNCLRKVVEICPKASQQVYTRFLNLIDIPKAMSIAFKTNTTLLYKCAVSQKHQTEFYQCMKVLFKEDWVTFKQIILQYPQNLKLISLKMLDIIVQILQRKCDFGGVQGCMLLTQDQTQSLQVANKLLKLIQNHQNLQFTKEIGLELATWYLHNCPYEKTISNPINQSSGQRFMRSISSSVCMLLRQVPISTILKVFYEETKTLRQGNSEYEKSNPYLKDLRLNTINYGVSILLEKLITPDKLTDVLTGQGKMFEAILSELENIYHQKHDQQALIQNAFESSELVEEDITQSFQLIKSGQTVPQQIKDWAINRMTPNNKVCLAKIPLSSNKVRLLINKRMDQDKQFYSFHLNKFAIGFQNSDPQNRTNILPQAIILYGGQTEENISYMAQLKPIEDQYFTQYGVKVFGVNFNTISSGSDEYKINLEKCRVLQIEIIPPSLCSVSEICQNSQKTNQNSIYHISFLIARGFKQNEGPINLQMPVAPIHLKLLSFLSQDSYQKSLQSLVSTPFFKTHFEKFMKVISHYLPDQNLQKLLSLIHHKNGNVLQFLLNTDHIEKNSENTCKIIEKLLKARFDIIDLEKAINFVLNGFMTHKYMDLISQCSRVVQYVQLNIQNNKKKIKFDDKVEKIMTDYIQKSLSTNKSQKELQDYRKLLCVVLNSPNVFQIDRVAFTHKYLSSEKDQNKACYSVLASYITSNQKVMKWWIQKNATLDIQTELLIQMETINQLAKQSKSINVQKFEKLYHIINLLTSLTNDSVSKQSIMTDKFPLKVFTHLRSKQTLLIKLSSNILRIFIEFFQNTCIQTECSQQFNQQLIQILQNLPQANTCYHTYFIHQFFFPLINTYKGRCVLFIWKGTNKYYRYPTGILQQKPIKANKNTIQSNGVYYAPGQDRLVNDITIFDKNDCIVAFRTKKCWYQANGNSINGNNFEISQNHKIYQISNIEKNLLTNQTLIRAKNPSIFGKNYKTVHAFNCGVQQLYFLPQQMKIQDMYIQLNICGYRINKKTIEAMKIKVQGSQDYLKKETKIGEIQPSEAIVRLEINTQQLFKYTDIQNIVEEAEKPIISFIPENTIFKTFQKLKGLQKMIKVMTTCVQNWKNTQQSKCWLQYLNELSSFSCFPIFSSIYMNKQENVQLLFDILLQLPDKEDNQKWIAIQKKSVKFLYEIIKDVFQVQGQQAATIRKYALESGFYSTMLQRLHIMTKEPKRFKGQQQEQQIEVPTDVLKKDSEDQYAKNKLKKKKGIGYGHDGNSNNQKWDVAGQQETRKEKSEQILSLLKILEKFLNHPSFEPPKNILIQSYESALLPILQSSLRGGSLLEISKYAQLFQQQLQFINVIASKKCLIPLLLEIPKQYQPRQTQSIEKLIKILEGTARIFLSCLTGSVTEKQSEEIAKNIIKTHQIVQQAIQHYKEDNVDQDEEKKILELPLNKKYPLLMKDLRFDYFDMKDKSGKIKHHYNSYYTPNHVSPAQKTIRLAQQLADISNALPTEHTNAIYVRCDKERVDFMQALIMGSNGTPYGHGAYLFDIYFEDNYPNVPPKVNLTTTGSGKIRFNPNLYSCGKVCLSLLGTWRGNAMQNWDPKVSTLLQVLLSIQSIIMAEEVYFNEPGFEHEQGTPEGQKKNEGYSNIVRYGNVKFAMTQNLRKPPKGFETVIKRHFYLKKEEILEECNKWVKYAQKRQASYNGLISDHNHNWANQFKKSKTQYLTMLQKAITELQQELNKLQEPSSKDLKKKIKSPKKKKQMTKVIESKDADIDEIDVTYDVKIDNNINFKEIDINDDKVKDRWSRYIGAMGIQAVNKQSKANILLTGLGPLGIQIAKNIVLSGCKKLSIYDPRVVQWKDLSGQFYVNEQDIGKNRVDASLLKLQALNHYVRVQKIDIDFTNLTNIKDYDVIIATELQEQQMYVLNSWARKINSKFITNDCYGPFGYIFNDFGLNFEVLDKNGQETTEVMIQNITCEEQGIVTLLKGSKHPYEDGQVVRINNVKGMINKDKQNTEGGQSINGTFHKVQVINQNSFKIGNTTMYTEYEGNGLARNMKMPIKMNFKEMQQTTKETIRIDENLQYYDFGKGGNGKLLNFCFRALSSFKAKYKNPPQAWNYKDSDAFLEIVKQLRKEQITQQEQKLVRNFSFTCSGTFAPLCAFFGGFTTQQAFKAITGKYMPVNQYFFIDYRQVIPQISKQIKQWPEKIESLNYGKDEPIRQIGLKNVIGSELLERIQYCRVFVVGSGAIGCQLLKNYAMIGLSTGQQDQTKKAGSIVVTDPDHIETSNLNRQFLFRQKHLQKPKSVTAAAAVTQMNKKLKGKIRAKLDKVCQATKDIFTNQFFQSMNIVTNALDNVQARQYIDMRCVENKVALLQSGTLSSKGHVQVILPYKTETYGSKADPAQEGQIPHCTLKMFPQETLHCVQWARDLFGKNFTLKPKALKKLLQIKQNYVPMESDTQMLKDSLKMIKKRPANFDDCIFTATRKFYQLYRNEIKQLLYTYPLDSKTKDGKPFWKLPKRPPTPIEQIQDKNKLHAQFITTYAVLTAKIFNVPFPSDFRTEKRMLQIAQQAAKIKIEPFVPSDKMAKQMAQQVGDSEEKKQQVMQQKQNKQKVQQVEEGQASIFEEIKKLLDQEQEIKVSAEQFEKDEDENGHIDLIYSMANLRASNYKLQAMDWITTKIKAGRITPALSTTTSCIAALQTIQLIKYLKECKLEEMRNVFLNLAVPLVQSGQPGQVEKIKIHESLQTNVWQRWEIGPLSLTDTLKTLISQIQAKYSVAVKVLSIASGGPIFSDIVLGLESKKAEKQQLLQKSIKDVISEQIAIQDLKGFVDLTLVMSVKQQMVKHVPTIRMLIKE